MFKGTVSQNFLLQVFHESSSPKPLKITLGSFQIFLKICGDIRKCRCTTGIKDTRGKFAPLSMTTPAANFASGTVCVVDTGSKMPPVSTISVANLLPVSMALVAKN
jgi:hypothetical protein